MVGRVIDQLRHDRRRRELITRASEINIKLTAYCHPTETRAFLRNLLRMDALAIPIEKIVVPADLVHPWNSDVLGRLGGMKYLVDLMQWSGMLDVRKAGLKRERPCIDLLPKNKKPTLNDEIDRIAAARERIIEDSRSGGGELGDLMYFEAILVARVECYFLGEAKSAAQRSQRPEDYEAFAARMREFGEQLNNLAKAFPLPRYDLSKASKNALNLYNTRVDAALVGVWNRVKTALKEHEARRIERYIRAIGASKPEGKFTIVDDYRGKFKAVRTAYELDEAGVWRSVPKEYHYEHIQEFLDSFDEMAASEKEEKDENTVAIAELERIAADPLGRFPELYELQLGRLPSAVTDNLPGDKFRQLREEHKRAALIELWGAARLCGVPSEQARNLASELIGIAAEDYRLRNQVLDAQIAHVPVEKAYGEKLVAEVIGRMVERWVTYFAKEPKLPAKTLRAIKKRLGVYFATLFGAREEFKLNWLRQARAHLNGISQMIKKALPTVEAKGRLSQRYFDPKAPWNDDATKGSAAVQLEKRGVWKQIEDKEAELNAIGFDKLAIKIAYSLLKIEFDYQHRGVEFKRGERKAALAAFMRAKAKIYNSKLAFVSGDA